MSVQIMTAVTGKQTEGEMKRMHKTNDNAVQLLSTS